MSTGKGRPGRQAKPSWLVSHHLSLDEGPDAYQHCDARDDGWTKVVLHPHGHWETARGPIEG